MTIRSKSAAILVIAVILLGVVVLRIAGVWKTESSKVPAKISAGEFEGSSDPAAIKGSYAFSDIEEYFNIPSLTMAKAFNLDTVGTDPATYQAKNIGETYEGAVGLTGDIGTDAVKFFVSLYNGIPYEGEEDTILPSTAIDILLAEGKVTAEEADVLYESCYRIDAAAAPADATTDEAAPAVQSEPVEHTDSAVDTTIKGKTTFNDLLDWGLRKAQIEEVLGKEMGKGTMAVKDFATAEGVEFSVYREALQEKIDSL